MEKRELPKSRPEDQGVNPSGIITFLHALEEEGVEIHGFTFVRHGHIIAEAFWKPYRKELPHMLFSLSKSFTSIAIGLAVHEGLINLEDLVKDFFTKDLPKNMNERFNRLNIRHLLTMSTGHEKDFTDKILIKREKNWARRFFKEPLTYEPGTHFLYNNMATYMLSAIITKVTGKSMLDYLKPRLFDRLSIENPMWETDPKGINCGAWGLSIKNGDIAVFGQLLLQRGRYEGQQVMPESWIQEATSKQISTGDNPESDWNQGYGYQFWRSRHNGFRGDGAFGQYCIVMPDQDAVIAINSGIPDMQIPMNLIYKHLLPAMENSPIPYSSDYDKLLEMSKDLYYAPSAVSHQSLLEKNLSGKEYSLSKNLGGFERLSFHFEGDILSAIFKSPRGEEKILMQRGSWLENHTTFNDFSFIPMAFRYVGSFSWLDDQELIWDLRFIETPFRYVVRCKTDGAAIDVTIKINVTFMPYQEIKLKGISAP